MEMATRKNAGRPGKRQRRLSIDEWSEKLLAAGRTDVQAKEVMAKLEAAEEINADREPAGGEDTSMEILTGDADTGLKQAKKLLS